MLFLRWIDFGGWSVESVLNVAIVQVLPVSKFNFQWDKVDGKLIIGNIGIGNINRTTRRRSDAMKPNAKRCAWFGQDGARLVRFMAFVWKRMGGLCYNPHPWK